MKVLLASARSFSWIVRSAFVAIAFGLAACGSSSQPAKPTGAAVGGGPAAGLPAGMESAAPLINSVTSAVPGLSPSQAATGVGSLLGLAQAKMPANQFAQLSKSIPGTQALIGGAQKAGLPSVGSLTGPSSLTSTLNHAGISPDQVSRMIPAVEKSISQSAGPSVGQAFASAVK